MHFGPEPTGSATEDGLTYRLGPFIIIDFMRLSLQRNIDRYLGAPICRVLSFWARLQKPADMLPPDGGIVVILLSEMGSLVLAQPLFRKIKSMWPGARLHVLVFERNREALELLALVPPENILTVRDQSLSGFARDSFRAIAKMRRIGIDLAIDAELFARISSIFSFLSGAGIRVGFHPHTQEGLYRGDFINRPVLYNPYLHIAVQLLSLADAVTSTTTPKNKIVPAQLPPAPPPIAVEADRINRMRQRLAADFPQIGGRRLVLIHPGGGILPIRAWPLANYLRIARQLGKRDIAVGVIGLAADKPLAERILQGSPHMVSIDLTGYTRTVEELIQLFYLADLLITNDGGPGHLAALTPIETIMLFGPETPLLYRPLGDKTAIFYEPVACAPCLTAYNHRNSPCDGKNICMQRISSDRVLQEALAVLKQKRLSPA